MPILPVPIPLTTPIANVRNREKYKDEREKDPKENLLPQPWIDLFGYLNESAKNAVQSITTVSLTAQSASIGATDVSNGALPGGLYNFRYYARITRPATVNSSLTITLDWRDGGVTISVAGAAITGNTTATFQDASHLIHIDSTSPVRYSTAYVSNGVQTMQYALYVVLERVSA